MTYEPVTLERLMAHQGWALRVAKQLVREEGEAEELVQRTWLAALRRPPGDARGVKPWIQRVILNLARERHRRRVTRDRHERAYAPPDPEGQDPLESLSREEIRRTLGEHLLELGEPYRAVVLERYFEGRSSAEIARRLGIPSGTVRWRLKVGLDQLRTDLDRRSHGDRSRWVSALVAFLPTELAPVGAELPDRLLRRASPALGGASVAGWVAILLVGLATALFLVRRDAEARPPDSRAARLESPATRTLEPAAGARRLGRAPLARPDGSTLAGSTLTEAAPSGLRVVVVDGAGRPVPEARVQVAKGNGFEERAATDEEGRTTLEVRDDDPGALGLPCNLGRVAVRALAPGHAASALVHVAPPFSPEHEVQLVVGGPEVVLGGRVLDTEGRPVPGAVVAWFEPSIQLEGVTEGDFQSPSYLAVTADQEGRFRLANLPQSAGSLGTLAAGFATDALFLDLREPIPPLELRLMRGASLSGCVRRPDGTPAANAIVACEPVLKASDWATGLPDYQARWRGFGETTRTDANGRYRLTGIDAWGPRTLWAREDPGELVDSITLELVEDGESVWDADLGARPAFRLALVDETRRPLAGWFVLLRAERPGDTAWIRRVPADSEGRVTVSDCPDSEASLDVFAPSDVGASFISLRIRPAAEERLIEVETRAGSSIQGRVVTPEGAPERGGLLVVRAVHSLLPTQVGRDAEGTFEQRLIPGHYVLTLQFPQTALALADFRLSPGEKKQLGVLALPEMGSLRLDGRALARGGPSPPRYSLYRLSDEDRLPGVMQVGSGSLEKEVLLPAFPGRYRVLTFDAANRVRSHTIRVRPHGETRPALDPGEPALR